MMELSLGLAVEVLVAVLLVVTIGYCALLNHRLAKLRSDEGALKQTIGELLTASSVAERAIQGLKQTAVECDHSLGLRLRAAETMISALQDKIDIAGDVVKHGGVDMAGNTGIVSQLKGLADALVSPVRAAVTGGGRDDMPAIAPQRIPARSVAGRTLPAADERLHPAVRPAAVPVRSMVPPPTSPHYEAVSRMAEQIARESGRGGAVVSPASSAQSVLKAAREASERIKAARSV